MEKLNEMDVQNKFQIKIQNRFEVLTNRTDDKDPEIEWENFKTEINKVAEEELGYRKIGKRKWISKEAEELQAETRTSKEAAMNPGKNGIEKTTELNELRIQLKKRMKCWKRWQMRWKMLTKEEIAKNSLQMSTN